MNRSATVVLVLILAAGGLGLSLYWLAESSSSDSLEASLSVADAMGSDTSGYYRAQTVREFVFPRDHGPHPGYKNEWWYLTGNLSGPDGARYGYELTIFRIALSPPPPLSPDSTRAPGWRTNQLYMGHFALMNGPDETFHAFERFSRGGAGLAGAQAEPFRVWLENWSMSSVGGNTFPVRLRASGDDVGIDLTVRPDKPMVLQGDRGLSQKGPGSGNASYYYSYTRLSTEGTLIAGGDTVSVSGQSWLDREWSTSALGPNQVGWDWFALQLEDGRDLMYYQLRNADGSASRFSEGILVGPDGEKTRIRRNDITIEVLDTWTSPDGTHTYPTEWSVSIPPENLDLRVDALIPNQELEVSVRYWEGAVQVEGSAEGRGYVELTGYGDSPASPTS